MKVKFPAAALFLSTCLAGTASAEIAIENVSPERAKELGITLRSEPNGDAGIRVVLEFKAEGELKEITYAELRIGDGEERIMSAPLEVTYPAVLRAPHSGSRTGTVTFSAFPQYMPRSHLMLVVYNGPKGDVGYQVSVSGLIKPPAPK